MIGSVATLPAVWSFADIANGLMAVPNLISLIVLTPVIVCETKRYFNEDRGKASDMLP
jgi:AGCS family alanine or glycine:cation symporter